MRQTIFLLCIATVRSLVRNPKPTATPFTTNLRKLFSTPRCGGFGKFSYVKVGCLIPYSKGFNILVKRVLNYCHPYYVQGSLKRKNIVFKADRLIMND